MMLNVEKLKNVLSYKKYSDRHNVSMIKMVFGVQLRAKVCGKIFQFS